MVVFILHGACHFVIWVIDELIVSYILLYCIIPDMVFPLGNTDAFSLAVSKQQ